MISFFLLIACNKDTKEQNPEETEDSAIEETIEFPTDETYSEFTEAIKTEMQDRGAISGAVAIFDANSILHTDSFGEAPDGSPLQPDAQFRIGSLNKVFTSLLVNKQVEAGLYELDDHYSELLPEITMPHSAEYFDQITVEGLLIQKAGLVDYLEIDGAGLTLETFMQDYASDLYIMNQPGVLWNYSNPNFYYAGYLAESKGDELFENLIQSEIWEPLGMLDTTMLNADVLERGNWAAGYTEEEIITPGSYENFWAAPAGYAWSTVMDLSTFGQYLLNNDGSVVSPETLNHMKTGHTETYSYGEYAQYGHGLFIGEGFAADDAFHPVQIIQHGGDIPGYATDFYVFPELGIGVVSLSGGYVAHPSTGLANLFAEFGALNTEEPIPSEWIALEDFSSYAGNYNDPFNVGEVSVTSTETGLYLEMPLLEQYDIPYGHEWTPYGRHQFIGSVQGSNLLITFPETVDSVKPRYLVHRAFVATREDGEQSKSRPQGSREEEKKRIELLLQKAAELDSLHPALRD